MALLFNDNDRFVYPYDRFNSLAADYLKFFYQQFIGCKKGDLFENYNVEPIFLGKGFYYSIIITDNNIHKRLDTETCLFVTKLYFHDILLLAGGRYITNFGGLGDDAEYVNVATSLIIALDEIVFTYFSHNKNFIQKWENFDTWAFHHKEKYHTQGLRVEMLRRLYRDAKWSSPEHYKNKEFRTLSFLRF